MGLLALAGGLGVGLTALESRPAEGKLDLKLFLAGPGSCSQVCFNPETQEYCLVDPLKPIIVEVEGGG